MIPDLAGSGPAGSGMADVQARIAQLRALTMPGQPSGRGVGSSSANFAAALATAVQQEQTGDVTGGTADPGEQAVAIGKRYLGVPYRWGGNDPATGLDCSGLTKLVFGQLGVDLPRVSRDQAKVGAPVASLSQARPGDLLFFGSPVDHVGIYAGDGKMVEAPHRGAQVRVHRVWDTPTAIRRVVAAEPVAGGAFIGSAALGSAALGSAALGSAALGSAGSGSSVAGTPFGGLFAAAGRKHGVDPSLLAAVAKAESGFNPRAVSHAGARGLMQLMPGTARDLGVDPMRPEQAVDGAARLLARYLRDYDGRVDLTLAAYNAGPGAVRRHGGVPPFDETRTYIQRVTRFREELR